MTMGGQTVGVQILSVPDCVTLHELLKLSEPQFPIL